MTGGPITFPQLNELMAPHPERIQQLVTLSYVKSVTEARFAFAAAHFFWVQLDGQH